MDNKILLQKLNGHIRTTSSIVTKNNFGKTLTDINIRHAMSFMSIGVGNDNAAFLTSGLFYQVNRSTNNCTQRIPFEQVLSKFYWTTTQTTMKKIEDLINSEFDDDGVFSSKFRQICSQMISNGFNLKDVDFFKLYTDLKFWNHENEYSRLNWAKSIFMMNSPTNDDSSTEESN